MVTGSGMTRSRVKRSCGSIEHMFEDVVGVALHLSRGSACARIGLACRLLGTLPETFALWEAGRIDTAKARAVDDATVDVRPTSWPAPCRRGCWRGRRGRPWPSSRRRWLVR